MEVEAKDNLGGLCVRPIVSRWVCTAQQNPTVNRDYFLHPPSNETVPSRPLMSSRGSVAVPRHDHDSKCWPTQSSQNPCRTRQEYVSLAASVSRRLVTSLRTSSGEARSRQVEVGEARPVAALAGHRSCVAALSEEACVRRMGWSGYDEVSDAVEARTY